ncbi:diadenosine tetraphosphatase [Rugosibacter aromaticivorans]|uniref:Bis(5'-nucleosyl)-tetraphosphatase, symmetrical n=1 Tax=Rugosibacter aromaticivorans TaxID=1565605 RepID=A0A0C5J683_9PROT|nr:symmetrical bis(5'-nucleosyl)-tetraphosphatase [Rugosibacter aromaticivorans]AJP47495.1 diadenosine tetraphosphatase [Rugosibacter aromaticivorans]TBR13026.1 MAG: symmetrical bis(5'-nucleosyl)-tetraphosphatase [Rugosibacter sp.]
MATYAIGDVQGCFDPLRQLIDLLDFNPASDRLWFVGDLVNRGPQSLEVLRYVKSLGTAAVVTLGNHDLHLVMQAAGYGRANKEDTLDAILAAPDRDELLDWLRAQPLVHVDGPWAMVHAGLLPEWTLSQAKVLSDEVSAALTSPNYRDFLSHMWGSEPAAWRDDLTGWDRLRVVVNAMTRMRYVTLSGAMELRAPGAKAPPEQGPTGCVPWFAARKRASAGYFIVCGHWSALGYFEQPDLLAIDTGCLWGGALTAVRLEDRRVFRLPCPQQVKPSGWD